MRHFRAFFSTVLLAVGVCAATGAMGQVAPSAFKRTFSLNAGVEVSGFQADYLSGYGFNTDLGGVGAFVDLGVWRGLGVEAEGRWLRFNSYYGVHQDNYLIGPRYKLLRFWKAQPYVKGLVGFTNMDFGPDEVTGKDDTGRFTTEAFGGGVDIKLNRKWNVRAFDFEYQKYPYFGTSTLSPYGASVGVSYKIF